ncbi:YafY family protein [Kineococcus sp. NUM-3379]
MSSATGRRLEVLAVLQARPGTTAGELARRLGVTERTARRDVAHLRDLGYRIDSEPGRSGGYTLAAGSAVPPLVLDADEALAVAVGLRATTGVADLGPAAVTALAKLTGGLPRRLRPRLEALAATETPAAGTEGGDPRAADPDVLVTLALACRAGEAVRLRTRRQGTGAGGARDVQPHRLVLTAGRWYLVACTRGEPSWRVHALDRIGGALPLGTRFPVPPPPRDAPAFVTETLAQGPWRHRVRVRLFTSGDLARRLVPATVGRVEDDGDDECVLTLGTDDLDWAARWLVQRNVDFDVLEPPELADRLAGLGRWLAQRYGRPGS